MKVGIVGNGFVGKATKILECKDIEIKAYDINPDLCHPLGLKLSDMKECDVIFVSVPTPMSKDGSVYTGIVQNVLNDLKQIQFQNFIVIRSTVPPGTCDNLNCYFMPEFLTEKNFLEDFKNNPLWIFGVLNKSKDALFKKTITQILNLAHKNKCIYSNNIKFMLNKEAEMVKYFRNTCLYVKVGYCNEIYEYCQKKKYKI